MSEQTGPVMQHAEEEKFGQSRAFTTGEVDALIKLTLFLGFVGIILGALVGGAVGLFVEPVPFLWSLWGGAAAGATLAAIPALAKAVNEMLDGLRSYEHRKAQSFAQPQSAQLPSPWRPPVPVHRREGTTMIDMNERPALPPPEAARVITPPVVAEILRASIEEYGGQWSRRKLMRLRVLGQKVSRGMYEELTSALHQCGILRQNRQGGFELPHDIERFEDLAPYLPSLPGLGGMGGGTGRDEDGGGSDDPPPGGEVGTLAERHRLARLGELEHSVRDYLEKKGLADV